MACMPKSFDKFPALFTISCRLLHATSTTKLNTPNGTKSSVDKDDVQRLDNLADEWWNERGRLFLLHRMNALRIPFIVDGLVNAGRLLKEQSSKSEPLHGIKLLDVGCGGGILTEPLARLGADATGLDAGEALINVAQLHAKKDPNLANCLQYVHSTIEEHAENNKETYDAVVASEVLEHVGNRETFLEGCVNTLKPGGSIFFTTLNKTFWSWFGAIVLGEKIFGLLPNGTHEWEKFVPPKELESLLNSYGCSTKVIHGMAVNPVTWEWMWTRLSPISYALHAVKNS